MSLTLEVLLRALYPSFSPTQTKVHLAQWNGLEHPLDVYYAGDFELWQNTQNSRNFSRPFLATLIATPTKPNTWVFAGLWRVLGDPSFGPHAYDVHIGRHRKDGFNYETEFVSEVADVAGRLTIRFEKSFRQSYPFYETIGEDLRVSALVDAPRLLPRFTGYRDVRLTYPMLYQMMHHSPEDWRTALTAVSGVYLITSDDGQLYVGSAYGNGGLWSRWSDYVRSQGHGGNRALKDLLDERPDAARGFQFAILETLDSSSDAPSVIARESHWKNVLGSRAIGLNLN